MKPDELAEFYSKVSQMNSPENLFGELSGNTKIETLQSLNEIYKELIKKFHPDKYSLADAYTRYLAGEISGIINDFNSQAKNK